MDFKYLTSLSTAELQQMANSKRTTFYGDTITYSPKVFIPLTFLCRDRCGYCTFAKVPRDVASPYLTLDEVKKIVEEGIKQGCKEALFTLGEAPEKRYKVCRDFLSKMGCSSTVEYLKITAELATELGMLCHLNAGALNKDELELLSFVSVSQGMMLESLNPSLDCHKLAPDKKPERRMATLKYAGELNIPFTTGLLVGIGDSEQERIEALIEINNLHRTYGNIQEVIIQNFLPKERTSMAKSNQCSPEIHLRTLALARVLLDSDISVQAPPNLVDDAITLVEHGANDLGGISPVTVDHVNPEKPWPVLLNLTKQLEDSGYQLTPRLSIYPAFQNERFVKEHLLKKIFPLTDSEGFLRTDSWISGKNHKSKLTFSETVPNRKTEIEKLIAEISKGKVVCESDIERLFMARGRDFKIVLEYADHLRSEISGDKVTYVKNRNINYTNVCTYRCKFCAFSKGPLSLNLRGEPYILTFDQIVEKAIEAKELGATELCLQGGIHPKFDGEFYLELIQTLKKALPEMHLHAFSALEIYVGANRLNLDIRDYLKELKIAGLNSLPGTAAEILDDQVRQYLCPDKINTSQWLEVHETAHEIGLTSNVTIMFGSIERPRSWAKHLLQTKNLAAKTGGFLEFVPLPFVHMGSPIYLSGKARKGPTAREALLMHAIGRIVYGSVIPNIQVSWVKMGIEGMREALRAGVNDLGGTLMEENISRAAGAEHGQDLDLTEISNLVSSLGRRLVQRRTNYSLIETNNMAQQRDLDPGHLAQAATR